MSAALTELEEKVRALSQSDKAALIRLSIGELEGTPDLDIENAWIAEAKRRHQELLDGRVKGIPGDQVFANVQALLAGHNKRITR
ncbi:MAG: addiction module protein [Betaproteobacteria bacterium]